MAAKITVSLPDDLRVALKVRAAQERRSLQDLVRTALETAYAKADGKTAAPKAVPLPVAAAPKVEKSDGLCEHKADPKFCPLGLCPKRRGEK